MQFGFYFDQTRCIGCYTCVVACKDWHDVEAGPANWRRVTTVESGKFPHLFVAFLSQSCHHCENPPCIPACPVEAIRKREADGIVVVDREECLGRDACGACADACPYGAPQFGAEENARMQKCDLCAERIAGGQKPICVLSCRTRALEAGPMEELRAKFRGGIEGTGGVDPAGIGPSVLCKIKGRLE